MKEKTYITANSIAAIVLIIIGVLIALPGAINMWRYSHVKNLSELTTKDVKNGVYVEGEIKEYIGYFRGGKFVGISGTWIEIDGDYDVYTIPMKDGKYIQIRVNSSDILKQLQNFNMGKGDGVKFQGRIQRCDNYNETFYDKVENVSREEVVRGYAITETRGDQGTEKAKSFFGGLLICVCGAIWFVKTLIHM